MKLSWASIMPVVPHAATVELTRSLGFDGHDLIMIGQQTSVGLDDVRSDIAAWAGRLEERICGRGVAVADVFGIPGGPPETMVPNHPDEREVEGGRLLFKDLLDLAQRLACPGITMLPGVDFPGVSHEASLACAATELGRRAAEALDRGIRFSVEPHVGSVCHSPAEILRLCEDAPGLELTLDYGHYISQGFSEAEMEPLLAHTRHFHACGSANGRIKTALRNNTIDWSRVIAGLRKHDFDGYLAIEYVWPDFASLEDVDVLSDSIQLRNQLTALLDTGLPNAGSRQKGIV